MSNNKEVVDTFVDKWLTAFKKGDKNALYDLLSSSMTFYSPVTHKPSKDRRYIDQILAWMFEIVDGLTYTQVFTDPQNLGVVLVFKGKNKRIEITGADFITLNKEGQIIELKVMIRPLKATISIGEEMKKRFQVLANFGTPTEANQAHLPPSSKL